MDQVEGSGVSVNKSFQQFQIDDKKSISLGGIKTNDMIIHLNVGGTHNISVG